ncbi:hypothetical protein QJQ45_002342 [Haematococcus lacustris]|nr:hypothetical protein QJQ45_002342 [Haematococcus lacustris]
MHAIQLDTIHSRLQATAPSKRHGGLAAARVPEKSKQFYDRDVSAALNIRRCAVGPGPRSTELCYWEGRPALPKPGQPGQEWVYLPDKAPLCRWRRKWWRYAAVLGVNTERVRLVVNWVTALPTTWPASSRITAGIRLPSI